MTELDPYAELGVPRDADEKAIKRGYRVRSKQTHPDADGGSQEAFERTKLALVVLTDPAKRERYDRTGELEDDEPDNARARAVSILAGRLNALIDGFLTSGGEDPRDRDLVAAIRGDIVRDLEMQRRAVPAGEEVLAYLKDLASRFGVIDGRDDVLRREVERSVARTEAEIETAKGRVADFEAALKLLATQRFRRLTAREFMAEKMEGLEKSSKLL